MKRLLLVAVLLSAVSGWVAFARPTSMGGPLGYIMVSGHSMEPTYYTGDLVLARRQESYSVGDIVAFATKDGNVIHRIVGGDAETGYDTKGDNNTWIDSWKDGGKPGTGDIIGKEWLVIPGGSKYVEAARQPGVLPAVLAFIFTAGAFVGRGQTRRHPRTRGAVRPLAR